MIPMRTLLAALSLLAAVQGQTCTDTNCAVCSVADTCTTCKTGYEVDANGACKVLDADQDGIPDSVECPIQPCADTGA